MMNTVADVTTTVDLPARAASVAQVADACADEGDKRGELSQPLVDAQGKAGISLKDSPAEKKE